MQNPLKPESGLSFSKKLPLQNLIVMKKLIIQLFIFSILATPGFCQYSDQFKLNLKGKVKSINEKTFQIVHAGDASTSGKIEQWFLNSFNEQGNKILDIKLKPDSTVDKKYSYSYNIEDRREEMAIYTADDLLNLKIVYQYDKLGNLTEDNSYDNNNRPLKKKVYLYDNKGNIMEENILNTDGELIQKYRYVYNSSNQKAEINKYKASGELEQRVTRKYDNKGNETEVSEFSPEGNLISTTTNLYQFDRRENWLKKTSYINNLPVSVVERVITYY